MCLDWQHLIGPVFFYFFFFLGAWRKSVANRLAFTACAGVAWSVKSADADDARTKAFHGTASCLPTCPDESDVRVHVSLYVSPPRGSKRLFRITKEAALKRER